MSKPAASNPDPPLEVSRARTVRFEQAIKQFGQPTPYTLWEAPERSPEFRQALKENRVMTIIQPPAGSQKDYGLVGYRPQRHASFVLFPRKLDGMADVRVVGIKYDLLATPPPAGPAVKHSTASARVGRATRQGKREAKAAPEMVLPEVRKFAVTMVCTAKLELHQTWEAASASEARRKALEAAKHTRPDFATAQVQCRVRRVKEA